VKPRRLSEVAEAVRGTLVGDDVEITSVATDSRTAASGSLFVALAGERHDGARFVSEARARGSVAALVHESGGVDGPAVVVASTSEALLLLAAHERARSEAIVVGVTGANGKTSTKDMAAAIAGKSFLTHASPASFNNEVGVPVTLLGAPPGTQVLIAELGARHVGDVAFLCTIARPDIAVVTNVGVAHMEVFGSWEKIVEASAEPVEALGADGVAVLNADDPVVLGYAERTAARVVTFGRVAAADVKASSIELDGEGRASFDLEHQHAVVRVRLPVAGEHMVSNALAAAAVGLRLGVDLDSCREALAAATVSRWRMETFTTPDGVRVLNDAYNANPESTAASLRTARWMAAGRRCIAVLGWMAELGPIADQQHERIGHLVARLGIDRLVVVGEPARAITVAAVAEGVGPDDVAFYERAADALADVRANARPGDVVVFKGSRVAGLESLAEALR
jgi:UDP-N-acetylmuramoyl-tripeptide--D-alanyl-D-alanine ligase